jgi:N-glycosylase/DNA lyase
MAAVATADICVPSIIHVPHYSLCPSNKNKNKQAVTQRKNFMSKLFKALNVTANELRLDNTLLCGQVFSWIHKPLSNKDQRFIGMVNRQHVLEFKQEENSISYRTLKSLNGVGDNNVERDIRSYFNLDFHISLQEMHKYFASCDPNVYAKIYPYFPGLRVVRQDPLECLISFICSSNNNVARITSMIQKLCRNYGTFIGDLKLEIEPDDKENPIVPFYAFPTLEQLYQVTETELRDLGFGYRAKYIIQTIKALKEKGDDYLMNLRIKKNKALLTSRQIVDELTEFHGVGYKVASCVALYSLDCYDLVPTDVHILRLVRTHYQPLLAAKEEKPAKGKKTTKDNVTTNMIKEYMDMFITIFGENAGWAQMILYSCQIQLFKKRLPEEIISNLFSEYSSTSSKREKSESELENEETRQPKKTRMSKASQKGNIKNEAKQDFIRITRSSARKLKNEQPV